MTSSSSLSEIQELKTQLVLERAQRIKLHDDAYPDVGMGMPWWLCLKQAQEELGYKDEDINKEKLK